jgi:hypothetical protein
VTITTVQDVHEMKGRLGKKNTLYGCQTEKWIAQKRIELLKNETLNKYMGKDVLKQFVWEYLDVPSQIVEESSKLTKPFKGIVWQETMEKFDTAQSIINIKKIYDEVQSQTKDYDIVIKRDNCILNRWKILLVDDSLKTSKLFLQTPKMYIEQALEYTNKYRTFRCRFIDPIEAVPFLSNMTYLKCLVRSLTCSASSPNNVQIKNIYEDYIYLVLTNIDVKSKKIKIYNSKKKVINNTSLVEGHVVSAILCVSHFDKHKREEYALFDTMLTYDINPVASQVRVYGKLESDFFKKSEFVDEKYRILQIKYRSYR